MHSQSLICLYPPCPHRSIPLFMLCVKIVICVNTVKESVVFTNCSTPPYYVFLVVVIALVPFLVTTGISAAFVIYDPSLEADSWMKRESSYVETLMQLLKSVLCPLRFAPQLFKIASADWLILLPSIGMLLCGLHVLLHVKTYYQIMTRCVRSGALICLLYVASTALLWGIALRVLETSGDTMALTAYGSLVFAICAVPGRL